MKVIILFLSNLGYVNWKKNQSLGYIKPKLHTINSYIANISNVTTELST